MKNSATLIPTVIKPEPNQYLKISHVEFKDGQPICYFTLHTEKEESIRNEVEE
jgi:hypothetical protein